MGCFTFPHYLIAILLSVGGTSLILYAFHKNRVRVGESQSVWGNPDLPKVWHVVFFGVIGAVCLMISFYMYPLSRYQCRNLLNVAPEANLTQEPAVSLRRALLSLSYYFLPNFSQFLTRNPSRRNKCIFFSLTFRNSEIT